MPIGNVVEEITQISLPSILRLFKTNDVDRIKLGDECFRVNESLFIRLSEHFSWYKTGLVWREDEVVGFMIFLPNRTNTVGGGEFQIIATVTNPELTKAEYQQVMDQLCVYARQYS